jgi:DNA topoisomerase-1
MVKRTGRYGPFLACSAFPKCRNIKNLADKNLPSTGVKCPVCGQGEIVPKRSRRGMFYACNRYPDCKTAFSYPPIGEQCPECKAPLVILSEKGIVKCSSKECKYQREQVV